MERRDFLRALGFTGAAAVVPTTALGVLAKPVKKYSDSQIVDLLDGEFRYVQSVFWQLCACGVDVKDKVTLGECKQNIRWGTFGKNAVLREPKWVRLIDCSTEHLEAILKTQPHINAYPVIRMVVESILEDREFDTSEGSNMKAFIFVDPSENPPNGALVQMRLKQYSSKALFQGLQKQTILAQSNLGKKGPAIYRAIRYILEDRGVNIAKGVQEWESPVEIF
ncbi:hypothetical protein KAR91_21110 [Candidatus Pacearchaeota archaeon]|nr:hypothetical protein [Candidatus Pacearchaeota archaeon]